MQIRFCRSAFFFICIFTMSYSSLGLGQTFFNSSLEQEKIGVIPDEQDLNLIESETPCEAPPEGTFDRNWNLSAWLMAHAGERSPVLTTQSGKIDPEPFHGGSLNDWKNEVTLFRLAWNDMIGSIPRSCVPLDSREESLGLTPQEESRIDTGSYQMTKVSYRGAHGERIPAFLLIPHGITTPRPAVLVMHQSLAICGKKEPAGVCLQGSSNLDFARDLARKGFIVLAPDSIGYGERAVYSWNTGLEYADAAPLLSRFPQSTLMGLRISDVKRGISFLRSLPIVNRQRVGMIGHSNGGIETLFSAAYDSRIKCAVSNAATNLIRRETYHFSSWAPGISRWAGWGYMPGLAFFNSDIANLPVEVHQLYAMIAPRSLFVSLIEDDTIMPVNDRISFAMNEAKRAFAALGGVFDFHTIQSGKTLECKEEWGTSFCLSSGYDRCLANQDVNCLIRYGNVGLTPECISRQSNRRSYECAHDLFWNHCRQIEGKSEAECVARFSSVGIDNACIQEATEIACRRDHGWYPETEVIAYPWLEACLKE